MELSSFDKIKYIYFKYSKLIIAFLVVSLILILFLVFKESYSERNKAPGFDEIQKYFEEVRTKDKNIYNQTQVELVNETSKGIDISSWQKEIEWNKLSTSDIDFVMIRCGFRNLSNHEIHEDSYFRQNIEEANKLGIPVGIYFYSTAISTEEAIEEASFVINLIKDYKIIYPVAYDFELFNKKRTTGISDEIINSNAELFLNYIEEHGYIGMLYTNQTNANYHWSDNILNKYNIWYAKYIDNLTYEGKYTMWQYADNGRIDGIKGYVDLNESNITYKEKTNN